jgi:hypothetical protein
LRGCTHTQGATPSESCLIASSTCHRSYIIGKDVSNCVVYVAQGSLHPALFCRDALLLAPSWVGENCPTGITHVSSPRQSSPFPNLLHTRIHSARGLGPNLQLAIQCATAETVGEAQRIFSSSSKHFNSALQRTSLVDFVVVHGRNMPKGPTDNR